MTLHDTSTRYSPVCEDDVDSNKAASDLNSLRRT